MASKQATKFSDDIAIQTPSDNDIADVSVVGLGHADVKCPTQLQLENPSSSYM